MKQAALTALIVLLCWLAAVAVGYLLAIVTH